LKKARELRLLNESPVLSANTTIYNRERFDPTQTLSSDQKQYLLNCDKHILIELIRIDAPLPPEHLKTGNHRAFQNVIQNP
jgi:hypothetical protein